MKTLLTMFCIACTCLLHAQTLKQIEYFFDVDKGVGKNTKLTISSSADSTYVLAVDVSKLATGLHKLYIRSKDSKNEWGLTYQRTIEIVPSLDNPEIIAGEYFFDTDPGFGKAKKISVSTQDTEIVQNFIATVSSLSNGYHELYTRFKDSIGRWSETNRRTIEIADIPDTNKVIAAEYFFSGDPGYRKATIKVFSQSSEDSTFKFNIAYNKIPSNADTLFIRTEDSSGNWSLTKIALFSIQSLLKNTIVSGSKADVINDAKLHVFPNPARDILNFSYTGITGEMQVSIIDSKGVVVKKFVSLNGNSNQINISELAAGAYILQFSDGKIIQSTKFIKQ